MEEKLQVYKFKILKKVSFENVKKYLNKEKKTKGMSSGSSLEQGG